MTKQDPNYKLLFSIYDTVTEIYEPPFVDINKGSAMRRIQDLMQSNPQSTYTKFPDNYTLMCIGTWNEKSSHIYHDSPEIVIELDQIIKTE